MSRTRVVFVCVGNACRSQMAEAFARAYGKDVVDAASAGLGPAPMIPEVTVRMMAEKGISVEGQFPKSLSEAAPGPEDWLVNLSGFPLPNVPFAALREWRVEDPIGKKDAVHARVRDEIEMLVMNLILELRQKAAAAPPAPIRQI